MQVQRKLFDLLCESLGFTETVALLAEAKELIGQQNEQARIVLMRCCSVTAGFLRRRSSLASRTLKLAHLCFALDVC